MGLAAWLPQYRRPRRYSHRGLRIAASSSAPARMDVQNGAGYGVAALAASGISWFSQARYAASLNGRPRKSSTSLAAGFEPPGASTAWRYFAGIFGSSRLALSNWLNRSFAITSDHM